MPLADDIQPATEAADLHEWEMSLRLAMLRAWPDVAATSGKPIWHPGSTHREAEGCLAPGRLAAALLPDERRLRQDLPGAD